MLHGELQKSHVPNLPYGLWIPLGPVHTAYAGGVPSWNLEKGKETLKENNPEDCAIPKPAPHVSGGIPGEKSWLRLQGYV